MEKNNTLKRNWTLKRDGLIGILVLLVAVLFILANRNLRNFESVVMDQTQQHLLNIAKSESQRIDRFVNGVREEARMLTEDSRIQRVIAENSCEEKCDLEDSDYHCGLATLFKHMRGRINGVYSLGSKGLIQCRVPWKENRIGADYSGKPGVKVVLQSQKPYVSEWFSSSTGNYKSVSVCQPVFHEERFVGIVRVVVRLDSIAEMISHFPIGKSGYAWIMDDMSEVIVHPNPDVVSKRLSEVCQEEDGGEEDAESEVISSMLKGTSGTRTLIFDELGEGKTVMAWAPIKVGDRLWSIGVCMPYDEVSGPVAAQTRNLIGGASFLVVILLGIGILLSRITQRQNKLKIELDSARNLEMVNKQLQEEIAERKRAEGNLQQSLEEMKRFNRLAVGRELRMIELKKEVDSLLLECGRDCKYGYEKEGIAPNHLESKSVSSVVDSSIDQDNNEEV